MIFRYDHEITTAKGALHVEDIATLAEDQKAQVVSISVVGMEAWIYLRVRDRKHYNTILAHIQNKAEERRLEVKAGTPREEPRGVHIVRYSSTITGTLFTESNIATIADVLGAEVISIVAMGIFAWTIMRVKDPEHYARIRSKISEARSLVAAG